MNSDISKVAKHARGNGWTVQDDTKGYTRFYNPEGQFVVAYPATPSNPRRRMADLIVRLGKAGLAWPPPSKAELRAQRRKDQ